MLPPAAMLVATLLLAGCVPSEPTVMPVPEPSATPIFASDEEALAAATEAYAKYVTVTDVVFQSGGLGSDSLAEVMTGTFLEESLESFRSAAEKGLRSTGQTSFDQVELQQYDRASNGEAVVVVYVCEDISNVDVLGSDGISVVSPDRPNRTLYEVTFNFEPANRDLLVSQRIAWSASSC